jgi:phage portal protein BeeE
VVIVHGSNGRTGPAWDPDAEVIGYIYRPGGPGSGLDPVFYLADEVAHFRGVTPDPIAPARGLSWLTPVIREIEADTAATQHKLAFFRNGASPSTIVTGIVPGAGQSLQDWVNNWRAANEGSVNAYKTQFYTPGVSVEVVGKDLGQIAYKDVTGAGETRLAAAAGVPPIVAGLSEGLQGSSLNAGNFDAAFRRFTDITMRPLWRNAAGSLATIIAVPGGAELWYDDRDIPALRANIKSQAEVQVLNAQAMRQLADGGWEPDSVVSAIVAGDWKLLDHTGKLSVQLQDPDAEPEPIPPELAPEAEPAAPTEEGA